jgi:hypothetical protein
LDELACGEGSPGRVVVHRLAGHDHERPFDRFLAVHASAQVAVVLERLAGGSLEDVELVLLRIAKRPQVLGRCEHEVD